MKKSHTDEDQATAVVSGHVMLPSGNPCLERVRMSSSFSTTLPLLSPLQLRGFSPQKSSEPPGCSSAPGLRRGRLLERRPIANRPCQLRRGAVFPRQRSTSCARSLEVASACHTDAELRIRSPRVMAAHGTLRRQHCDHSPALALRGFPVRHAEPFEHLGF